VAGVRRPGKAKGGAIVDDPVRAGSEEGGITGGGANGEDASASGFARKGAGRRVFDDDAILRRETKGSGAFEVRLRVGLAVTDVGGGYEMLDVIPQSGGTETYFGEGPSGGSDDGELAGKHCSKKRLSAGQSDDIGDILDFGAFHPIIFGEMNSGIGMGKKFANGGEAGAAVGELHRRIGVEIMLEGPAGPDTGDGGSGVDENAIHVDEKASAVDLGHFLILAANPFGAEGEWMTRVA
jgi:hypothetical protein